jgi:hypothetical protein
MRTLNGDGTVTVSGNLIQVSRLGMPLVNEVVIPLKDKDKFNATKPSGDGAFLPYVLNPELAGLFTAIYGFPTPPAPRNDLVAVFLTGIPGLNQPANPSQVPCEMLRLNLSIPPAAKPSRLGLLGGDIAGFPNGRRLADDVVDIAERVVAGATAFTPAFNVAPNNELGDGIDGNDLPFLPYFPYVAPPHNPADHEHHDEQKGASFPGSNAFGKSIGSLPSTLVAPSDGVFGMRVEGVTGGPVRLEFSVPAASRVTLKMYDVQGRAVRTLINQDAAAGTFYAQWDRRGDDGVRLGGGVYFARLVSNGQSTERKVVID